MTEHDARRLAELHGTDEVTVHLLVPADAEHNRLIEALDEIALGRLRDPGGDDDQTPQEAELDAMHAVNASIDLLKAAGLEAHGSVTRAGCGGGRHRRRVRRDHRRDAPPPRGERAAPRLGVPAT